MMKEIVEIPVLSESLRRLGVPLSAVTRANGFLFVSGTPPLDTTTGALVRGDIETQTEASLKALKHCLESAGSSLEKVVMVRVYASNAGFFPSINRVFSRFSPPTPPRQPSSPAGPGPMEFDTEMEAVAPPCRSAIGARRHPQF